MRLSVSGLDQATLYSVLRELSGDESSELHFRLAARSDQGCAEVVVYADPMEPSNSVARLPSTREGARFLLDRLVDALAGKPGSTPSPDEHWMSFARTASWRSSSVQIAVGATLVREDSILGVGTNEVPLAGGAFNWTGDADDVRDYHTVSSGGATRRQRVIDALIAENGWSEPRDGAALAQLNSVIDVERAVHAEVAAVLSAGRIGVSVVGATMYATHRPCYRCERFLAAAGVIRVVYDRDSNSRLSEPLSLQLRAGIDLARFVGIRWELLEHAVGNPRD